MIAGLMLAGGRSTRFGADKALARVGNQVLMEIPLAVLHEACGRVAISTRAGSAVDAHARGLGEVCLHDRTDRTEGPLLGIHAGLVWAQAQGADHMLTVGCDTPGVTIALCHALRKAVDQAGAAVARSQRGVEPLVAVWPVARSLRMLDTLLDQDDHPSMRAVLVDLEAVEVAGFDGVNINRPSDMADYLTRIA